MYVGQVTGWGQGSVLGKTSARSHSLLKGRTKLHQLKLGRGDLIAVLVTAAFLAFILIMQGLFPGLI